jgi:hypothetical protein
MLKEVTTVININKLDSFFMYRTKKKFFVASNTSKLNKGLLVSVFSPTFESDMKTIFDNHTDMSFKELKGFLTHRKISYKPYLKTLVVKTMKENEVSDRINKAAPNNSFDNQILINPAMSQKTKLMGRNAYYDFSTVLDLFLNNTKDKRQGKLKAPELKSLLLKYLVEEVANADVFSDVNHKVLIIPVNEWLEFSEYKKSETFKTKSDNPLIMLYFLLEDEDFIKALKEWKIILTNYNEFIILNLPEYLSKPAEEKGKDNIAYLLRRFLYLCKSSKDKVITDDDAIDGMDEHLKEKVAKSEAELKTSAILASHNIKEEDISEEKIEEIKAIVEEEIAKGDNIENLDKDISDESIDAITDKLKAHMSTTSYSSYSRNKMLKEKYKEIKIDKANPKERTLKTGITKSTPKAHIAIEELKNITSVNINRDYVDSLYYKDLMGIISHFMGCTPAMFLLEDIKEDDISSSLDKLYRYTVKYEDANRKRHNVKFLLPKIYQDNYFFLNGSKKDITFQKFPYPLTKIDSNIVQLASNYNKIFVSRTGANVTPKLTKLIKCLNEGKYKGVTAYKGNAFGENDKWTTSIEHDELSKVFHKIAIGTTVIQLSIPSSLILVGPTKMEGEYELLPIAKSGATIIYYNVLRENVLDSNGNIYGSLSDYIIDLISKQDEKFVKEIEEITTGKRFMYTNCLVMTRKIPTILLAASITTGGLVAVMNQAKIEYTISEKRTSIDKMKQGAIAFSDGYIIYDRYPLSNSLLMEGLSEVDTKVFSIADMGDRETYMEIFDILFGKRNIIESIENFRQLFVDPITREVLQNLNQPTDFVSLLLMSNDMLADNRYKPDSSYEEVRIRGFEIVMAYLYRALSDAYGKFRINPEKNPFSIPEDIVIKYLMKSPLVNEHSAINTILEAENDRAIKAKGPIGLNVDEAYTIEKRAFHKSMRGVVALSTAASGEVGITRNLTVNTNVIDPRGYIVANKETGTIKGSEMLSPSEMMNIWSAESGDANRTMYTTGQHKHLIPTQVMCGPLVSYDFERVLPYMSKDFAYIAKDDGQVLEINNDIMIIEYKDGTKADIDLAQSPLKHTNAGSYLMTSRVCGLKAGEKFKKDDILVYDDKHFTNKDVFGDVVGTIGTMAKIMLVSDGSVYEDSTYITDNLAQQMATLSTVNKPIVVSKFTNVTKWLKIGDKVEVNDHIIIFNDSNDEFISGMFEGAEEDIDEVHFGATPVKSKVTGTVKDLKVYYTVPFDTLTPSMQKFIKSVSSHNTGREKAISKHMDIRNAETVFARMEQTEPDSLGRVKGIKVDEGVLIEYFIEYLDVMGVADKLTYNSAIKGTVNNVIPTKYAAFTESYPDEPISAAISTFGTLKRMVLEIHKVAICNKVLIEAKREFRTKFYDRLKSELK